jgi:hypothetical protein
VSPAHRVGAGSVRNTHPKSSNLHAPTHHCLSIPCLDRVSCLLATHLCISLHRNAVSLFMPLRWCSASHGYAKHRRNRLSRLAHLPEAFLYCWGPARP